MHRGHTSNNSTIRCSRPAEVKALGLSSSYRDGAGIHHTEVSLPSPRGPKGETESYAIKKRRKGVVVGW